VSKYQVMPALSQQEYEELEADILKRGVQVPLEFDEAGNVLDGYHRLKICEEHGLGYPSIIRAGMTEEEKIEHAWKLNLARRHLTREQRRELVLRLRREGQTYRAIGERLGVSDVQAIRDVRYSVATNVATELPDRIEGKDGKSYQAQKTAIFKPPKEEVHQPVAATVFSSKVDEYYTPSKYIEAVRQVLGGIDLDPASCELAQKTVRAKAYYTKADDGLSRQWSGRVFLNPPYGTTGGQSNQGIWAQRLIGEHQAGNVTAAILLVKAALGYQWFENIWRDWPVCFARERLSFGMPDGTSDGQSKQATALFYFGKNVELFTETFRQFGRVIPPEV